MLRQTTRRDFMKQTAALSTAVWVSGQSLPAASRSPNEKLNIAAIGSGGKGKVDIAGCSHENIVALCDADDERAAETYKKYPNVPKYKDYRKMLEERKDIDAVIVSTPDHHHAPASVMAMKHGKHVYCQKPLTHSIYESRRMREVAREMGVVTQMGNQGHAFNGAREIVELIRDGAIGPVREVHCWTDRPGKYWHQPVERPQMSDPVPRGLDWEVWLGPAPERPYGHRGVYCPHNWRAWWDFGSGALGDMACHIVDPAFWALELGAPISAEATAEGTTRESAPAWQIIHYKFPERQAKPDSHWKQPGTLPAVTLTWYDSGKKPPQELGDGKKLSSSGTIFVGEKGRLYSPSEYGMRHILLPRENFQDYHEPAPFLPRNPLSQNAPYIEWIAGCKGGPMSLSNFEYASRLTEAMLVGVLAVRLGKRIEWDSEKMQATNAPEAAPIIKREYRRGWTV
jgi:predicted dehydrogenase